MENKQYRANFSAVNRSIASYIVKPTERKQGKAWVQWGDRDKYPAYLYDLFCECATLRAVIDGTTDYVCGNGIQACQFNKKEEEEETFRKIVQSQLTYGGFALYWSPKSVISNFCNVVSFSLLSFQLNIIRPAFSFPENFSLNRLSVSSHILSPGLGTLKFTKYEPVKPLFTEFN